MKKEKPLKLLMAKSQRKTVKVDLWEHCFYHPDKGIMLTVEGIKHLTSKIQDECDMCWQLDDVNPDKKVPDYFLLKFSRVKHTLPEKLPSDDKNE